MQIETTTLQQDAIVKSHQQYLQALREWNKNIQLKTHSNSPQIITKPKQFLHFPNYLKITNTITDQHANWQIDTIEKLLNRNETRENIHKMVHIHKPIICPACNRQKHPRWNCPQEKKQAQLRRYKLSKNERKDNQMGDYACREPFQL